MQSRTILGLAMLALVLAPAAVRAQLSADQVKCLDALNKDAAKLAAAQGKAITACIKSADKGKLPAGQSADQCLVADAKGKIAKARGKIGDDFNAKCGSLPTFGVPAAPVADTIAGVAIDQPLNLLNDVLGASLSTAAIDCDTDAAGCGCQRAVSKAYEKLLEKKVKQFVACKASALGAGATSAMALEQCIDDAGTAGSIAADSDGTIAAALSKLGDAVDKKCAPPVSTALALPGLCAGQSGTALRDCIDQRVECRVCLMLNATDNLGVDCDSFDDGQVNLSCPYETFTLRSPAQSAHDPGSPGVTVSNAKLIQQFGGADVSLNNARYTRFRLSPTTSEADAILILIPGFEGGANDFKILAENLIPKVFTEQGLRLEVWAYDRRSNQLEDSVGLDIAEARKDPLIALDWLFGTELGLTLDPDLVAGPNRRAVFYNNQSDTPFIAEWTPLLFSRDINAIVDKARSLANHANVFLGGHSAGTGFAAR